MKKLLLKLTFSTLIMSLGVGMFFALGSKSKKPEEAQAVGKDSYWSSWITSNSSKINNTSDCREFVTALKSKITQTADGNSNTISYAGLWDAFKYSDPVPGSENDSTVLIWDMYGGFQFRFGTDQAGTYKNEGDKYNREHSVPKSWFSEHTPAYSDLVHLVPTDGKINGYRSNYAFGEVSSASYTYPISERSYKGVKYQEAGYSKYGTPKTINGQSAGVNPVFEPDDQFKGDFARIYMYFAVRYGGGTCSATDEAAGAAIFSDTLTHSNPYVTNYGKELLKKWHVQDPVSEKETKRNDVIEQKQGNRNPFVDYPEWADTIFGSNYEATHGSSSTPSIGIGATATTIQVNGTSTLTATLHNLSGTPSWAVTDGTSNVIQLSSSSGNSITVTGKAVGTKTVRATVGNYSNTIDITVSNKTLSSISVKTAPTKTTYTAGEYFDPTGLVINRNYSDSTSDTYTYANHTGEFTFTPTTSTALATTNTSVTITYGGKSCSQPITVNSSSGTYTLVTSNSSVSNGDKVVLTTLQSGSGDVTGVTGWNNNNDATVSTTSSEWKQYTVADASNSGFKLQDGSSYIASPTSNHFKYDSSGGIVAAANDGKFVCNSRYLCRNGTFYRCYTSVGSYTPFYIYKVNSSTPTPEPVTLDMIGIDISDVQDSFTVGDTFNYDGLVVTAYYSDDSEETLSDGDYTVSSPNMSTAGEQTITVSYEYEGTTKTANYTITVYASVTSISATVSKTYHPGETISSSDITVKDNNNNTIDSFTFANDEYRFTYADAASGGASTNKTFTNSITAVGKTCSLTVQVQRVNRTAVEEPVTDTITSSDLVATSTTYKDFSNVKKNSDARYAGNTAKDTSGRIQMRNGSSSGIVSTTSGGTITSVTINVGSGSNTVNVYGKKVAYSSASDLYTTSTQGTLVGSTTSTGTITFTTGYAYVGIRSNGGAIYLTSVAITYGSEDSATNVANYIMYEDTNGQCTSKFTTAKGYFEGLSVAERASFMTSDDYVISTARERFEAWARYLGKTITLSNGDYVVTNAKIINVVGGSENTNTITIVIIISSIGLITVGGYFFLKRRKENY